MNAREREEAELALERPLRALARVLVEAVPLVRGDHERAAALEDVAGKMRVLVGDAVRRIDDEDHDVGTVDRLHRLHHRELLDRLEHAAALAHAGGVDEQVAPAVALERHLDRVARGPGGVEHDHAVLAEQAVHQRRLAHVRPADDRDPRLVALGPGRELGLGREIRKHRVHQRGDALAVRRGDRMRLAQPELVELRGRDGRIQPLGLVRDEPDAGARLAQLAGDPAILRRDALARVGEEDDRVGLGERGRGLLRHLAEQSLPRHRLEPAGVDDVVGPRPEPPVAVVPVAREARGRPRRARRATA